MLTKLDEYTTVYFLYKAVTIYFTVYRSHDQTVIFRQPLIPPTFSAEETKPISDDVKSPLWGPVWSRISWTV